jgi:hypothetical protein
MVALTSINTIAYAFPSGFIFMCLQMPIIFRHNPLMQKRSSMDLKSIANRIAKETSGIPLDGKNPAAVALGRMGGLKGGKARAAKLAPEQRSEIARRAAAARWMKEAE